MAGPPQPWLKPAVLTGALVPLLDVLFGAATGGLGPNAISEALNRLGLVALVLLIAGLTLTPLRLLFGWTWPGRIRRWVGNLAFTYALLHLLTYALVDQGLDLRAISEDVTQRPFILIGSVAFVLLIPLAVTSTDAMVKRLGYLRWKRLHRLAYVATGLGALHFFLKVKADVTEPVIYAAVIASLFAIRGLEVLRSARARRRREA